MGAPDPHAQQRPHFALPAKGPCTDCVHGQALHEAYAPPSLCYHKNAAQSAALCVFDVRAGPAMVARFGLTHRGLSPCMVSTRQHYVLTSHSGTPISVWDRRQTGALC